MWNQSTQHELDDAKREWKPSRPDATTPQEDLAFVEGLSDRVLLELHETCAYWLDLADDALETRARERQREVM